MRKPRLSLPISPRPPRILCVPCVKSFRRCNKRRLSGRSPPLPFDGAVELGAAKQDDEREPDPGEESHRGSKIAVDAVVAAESLHVPAEEKRRENPEQRSRHGTPAQPWPRPASMTGKKPVGRTQHKRVEDTEEGQLQECEGRAHVFAERALEPYSHDAAEGTGSAWEADEHRTNAQNIDGQ